ncbi:MAG: 16S rRNA (cytosine(1402)-N(4))-methyltransferase RsmH [Candidatus Zambryskibacteria bacterium]|nr:16S rRNA (cytosine(1402)-N(4))-methyltransferase RsmH [Candidatus Zambryskibacteria bacterium]
MIHRSVLLQEVIKGLDIQPGDVVVDGTLGNGGHTKAIADMFGTSIKQIGIDLDQDALDRSKERLADTTCDMTYVLGSFRNIDEHMAALGQETVNKVLLDIGLSSNQLEESGRGFAFRSDEPLKMTFKKELGEEEYDAHTIVNTWDEDSLRTIIRSYGEERFAGRIARGIVRTRELSPIGTTTDLVNVILASTPRFYHHGKTHPATRTFQALRITVNDEIYALEEGLEKSFALLAPKGRLAIISFHSLEDRLVKEHFKSLEAAKQGIRITKKPITPKDEEVYENPRSRSAKLRIIEKN